MADSSIKSLRLLIKMEKKNLDEFAIAKQNAEDALSVIEADIATLNAQREDEFYKYTGTEYAVSLENYMKNSKKILQNFHLQKQEVEKQITILQDKIFDVFTILKKYETLLEQKLTDAKSELEQKEQSDFDEMNSIRYSTSMKESHNENQ